MRKIKFRGIDMAGAYVYGLLSVKRRGKKIRYFIVNEYETVQVHQNSVAQLIAADCEGTDIYEGDPVIRIKEWSDEQSMYIDVEAQPMYANFEDYGGILDGEIVMFRQSEAAV